MLNEQPEIRLGNSTKHFDPRLSVANLCSYTVRSILNMNTAGQTMPTSFYENVIEKLGFVELFRRDQSENLVLLRQCRQKRGFTNMHLVKANAWCMMKVILDRVKINDREIGLKYHITIW